MPQNIDLFLEQTSQSILDCIDAVVDHVQNNLVSSRQAGAQTFATVNTFTQGGQVQNLQNINSEQMIAMHALLRQPIIAQVQYRDEKNELGIVYITRTQPPFIRNFKISSRNSVWGRLATLEPGDDEIIITPNGDRNLLVDAKVTVFPERVGEKWDAKDTQFYSSKFGNITIRSLRELVVDTNELNEIELDSAWSDEEGDGNVIRGILRPVITHLGLRDQPILDKKQDEIFRLPINSRCFLSGPPGTGKTTTLIRRLGQKTDPIAISESPEEHNLVKRVDFESKRSHASNWIMFSPTELLRQYVKEAFAREGQVASDDHIRTWDEFRNEIARDYLGLLKKSNGGGPFIVRPSNTHLLSENNDCIRWYDDFEQYLTNATVARLTKDAEGLRYSEDQELKLLAQQLENRINPLRKGISAKAIFAFRELEERINELVFIRRKEIDRIFTRFQNRLSYTDKEFPDKLRTEISRINRELTQSGSDGSANLSLDDDEELEEFTSENVSLSLAVKQLRNAIRMLATYKATNRNLSKSSRNGRIVAWLGKDRLPSKDDLLSLNTVVSEQRRLKNFIAIEKSLHRMIMREYRAFRNTRAEESIWYNKIPEKPSDLDKQELDLLVLMSLRFAGRLIDGYRSEPSMDLPGSGTLGAVMELYRAQILVDEATDFSLLQLACMYELSHPSMRSFFLCGDMNQRLTSWGLKSAKDLEWIDPSFEMKKITVSYRQSERLVKLAQSIEALDKMLITDTILPDRVDIMGVPPVLASGLEGYDNISDWLFSRIKEIDSMVREATTIAVLVNSEEHVEPLAKALNDRLEEISLAAVACRNGRDVGNDRDVRVFDIQHIKGLEFEGVFFVGLDDTIQMLPDLYSKYLYVGATRAATYLGVTFSGDVPKAFQSLDPHFIESWSNQV